MAWGYKATITIDNTKVSDADSADLTNFPILISGTYDGTGSEPDLRATGSGGKMTSSSGYDIGFYSDAGLTTALKYERELHNTTTGAVVYWVKVPTLDYNNDTVIYMAYGDSGITTDQQDVSNTWNSNYKAVWHLSDLTTSTVKDSVSGQLNNGTKTGANSPVETTGIVNKGQDFNDTNYIDCGSDAVLNFNTTDAYTIECWAKRSTSGVYEFLVNKDNYSTGYSIAYYDDNKFTFRLANDALLQSSITITDTNWHYLVATYDNTSIEIYIDGTSRGTGSGTMGQNTGKIYLGTPQDAVGNATFSFSGDMDETRISAARLTVGWIVTTYNAISSPSTFYTMGNETTNAATRGFISLFKKIW